MKDFHHPAFPKNSSFKQLIETVNSRPIFSKGHWRQTLTRPKQPIFARIEKLDEPSTYDTDVNYYEYHDFDDASQELESIVGDRTTTAIPHVYSTLYYDDFPTSSEDASIVTERYYDQVVEIIIQFVGI